MSVLFLRARASRCVLALASIPAALPVLAQVKDEASLATVTITATRTPSRVTDVVAEVTVLDREALDRNSGRTLVEVLSQQPGLQFTSNGGLGKAASLFIRGLESRHTLLLVDGIRVGSATLGTPSLDNLPLEAVERIEIVRGPMSALYGSDAVGGVIQIFTRRGRVGLHPNAKATVGSNHYGQLAGGVAFGSGAFDAAVQVQHTETRGFSATNARAPFGNHNPDDDGFTQNGGSLRLGWRATPDWRLEALALQADGTTRYDDGPGADSKAKLHNRLLSLQASGRLGDALRTKLSAAQSIDEFDTLVSASAFAALGPIETVQKQFAWETSLVTPAGTALALLERIEQGVSRPGAPFAVSDRTINAAALGLNGSSAGHTWQASVRHDRNSQFGGQTTGALGWGYEIAPQWRVGASAGTSFVAPSFNQLYFPGFGNPNLQPEEGKHGELSVRWTGDDHSARAAWFDNRIRGYISSGPAPANIPRTRIDGVTLSYEGRFDRLTLAASLDHVDPRNATEGSANFGKQLPRRAKNAAKAQADWSLGAVTVGAAVVAFSERFDNAANTVRMPGYATLDLHAEWSLTPDWTLGARLNNAANKAYETAFGYNQPGREAYLSVRYAPR
jgi:vitamin B12 transporter